MVKFKFRRETPQDSETAGNIWFHSVLVLLLFLKKNAACKFAILYMRHFLENCALHFWIKEQQA